MVNLIRPYRNVIEADLSAVKGFLRKGNKTGAKLFIIKEMIPILRTLEGAMVGANKAFDSDHVDSIKERILIYRKVIKQAEKLVR